MSYYTAQNTTFIQFISDAEDTSTAVDLTDLVAQEFCTVKGR